MWQHGSLYGSEIFRVLLLMKVRAPVLLCNTTGACL
jgi:hypothetical protein